MSTEPCAAAAAHCAAGGANVLRTFQARPQGIATNRPHRDAVLKAMEDWLKTLPLSTGTHPGNRWVLRGPAGMAGHGHK